METIHYKNFLIGRFPDTDRGYTVYNNEEEMAWAGHWGEHPQHGMQFGANTVPFNLLRDAKKWIDDGLPLTMHSSQEHLVFANSREEAEEKLRKHRPHIEQGVYLGGCAICQWEEDQKRLEIRERPLAYLAYFAQPEGLFGSSEVLGILRDARTQEDIWQAHPGDYPVSVLLSKEPETEQLLRQHILQTHPLTRGAEWILPEQYQEMFERLPKGRVARALPSDMYFNWNPVAGGRDMDSDGNLI